MRGLVSAAGSCSVTSIPTSSCSASPTLGLGGRWLGCPASSLAGTMESWAAALFGGGGVGPGGGEMLAGVVGRPPRPRGRRGDCGFGSLVGGHPGDLLSRSEGGGLLHAVLTPQAPIPADLAPRGVGVGALSGISLWPAVAATTSATYVTPSSSLGATSRYIPFPSFLYLGENLKSLDWAAMASKHYFLLEGVALRMSEGARAMCVVCL